MSNACSWVRQMKLKDSSSSSVVDLEVEESSMSIHVQWSINNASLIISFKAHPIILLNWSHDAGATWILGLIYLELRNLLFHWLPLNPELTFVNKWLVTSLGGKTTFIDNLKEASNPFPILPEEIKIICYDSFVY